MRTYHYKQGRERYCEVKLQKLSEVTDWIEPFRKLWADRFDALDEVLNDLEAKPVKKGRKRKK